MVRGDELPPIHPEASEPPALRPITPEIMEALRKMAFDYQCGDVDAICIIGFKNGGVPQFYNTIEDLEDLTIAVDTFRLMLAEDEDEDC